LGCSQRFPRPLAGFEEKGREIRQGKRWEMDRGRSRGMKGRDKQKGGRGGRGGIRGRGICYIKLRGRRP